jgi:hypothetical protein
MEPNRWRRRGAIAAMSVALAVSIGAWRDVRAADFSDVQLNLGVKGWFNEWTSWDPVSTGNGTIKVIESVASNTHDSVIPQASVRYGKWLVTGSYFLKTDYTLGGLIDPSTGTLTALSASRKELDGNFGYSVLPGLIATLGYKQIEQDFGASAYKWTGPTVGLTASAPLAGALAFYGTFAYGRLNLNSSTPDDAEHTSFHADYELGELGLAYGVSTPLPHLSFSVTAGYRIQVVSTRKFDLSTGFGGYEPVDVHDITQGPAITIFARF